MSARSNLAFCSAPILNISFLLFFGASEHTLSRDHISSIGISEIRDDFKLRTSYRSNWQLAHHFNETQVVLRVSRLWQFGE